MAYILGFFVADGYMVKTNRNTHFISFQITDRNLLYAIRDQLNSNHAVRVIQKNIKWKPCYKIQFGSKVMFADLTALGMTQGKSKTVQVPNIPERYVSHFIRGYFDGDGSVHFGEYFARDRGKKRVTFMSTFTSGSSRFLEQIRIVLQDKADIKGGTLYKKPRGYQLAFSYHDSVRLFRSMYSDLSERDIYLDRKYNKFKKAIEKMYGNI